MHFTAGGPALSRVLIHLVDKHDNVAIAAAWASAETQVFQVLKKCQKKIRRAVIGTHFYQTHPDVLDNFIACDEVRFVLQPQGIFHPKAYLFWSEKN